MDEEQVAQVDDQTAGLSEDKDGILAQDGIHQQQPTPGDTEVPEGKGHHTSPRSFTRDPLNQKPGRKQSLSQEPQSEQALFQQLGIIHHQPIAHHHAAVPSVTMGLIAGGAFPGKLDAVFLDFVVDGPAADTE